jgi:hypothetical protein
VPVVLVGSLIIQKVFLESRYDVSGHAAEHLNSATAPFFAAALVIILLWTTPPARRQPDILLACAAWLIATVLVLVVPSREVGDSGDGWTADGGVVAVMVVAVEPAVKGAGAAGV